VPSLRNEFEIFSIFLHHKIFYYNFHKKVKKVDLQFQIGYMGRISARVLKYMKDFSERHSEHCSEALNIFHDVPTNLKDLTKALKEEPKVILEKMEWAKEWFPNTIMSAAYSPNFNIEEECNRLDEAIAPKCEAPVQENNDRTSHRISATPINEMGKGAPEIVQNK
jgi:hypothetical protein